VKHASDAARYIVKAATTSANRIDKLAFIGAEPFIINIDSLTHNVKNFLQANILMVNMPSKNVAGFSRLVDEMKVSEIENVVFVSSTSVYKNIKKTMTESDTGFFSQSLLLEIEDLFIRQGRVRTTIVRFGGLIGYRRHPGWFFSSGRIVQNPESPVNLIHRDDCVGIIGQIVEQEAWGEVLNGCADTHPTKREFYTRAVALINGTLPEFGEHDPGSGKIISNQKVKQLLG